MSSSDLRELFEACKTGDLVKVKKLLTPQNVNEIGELGQCKLQGLVNNNLKWLQTLLVDDQQRCISPAAMDGRTWWNFF